MTYLPDMHSYLHQSSLLIQAYPATRITTKYSLPRKPNPNSTSKRSKKAATTTTTGTSTPADPSAQPTTTATTREKREPAATLTLKTYHADTGICLKYRTDKAQEVGRLLNGLGRLAKGEIIEMPSTATSGVTQAAPEDKMELDAEVAGTEGVVKDGKAPGAAGKSSAEMTQAQPQQQGGGGKKKKKGKK